MTDFYVYDGKTYTSELLTDIYNKNVLEINSAVAETLISRIYIGYGFFLHIKNQVHLKTYILKQGFIYTLNTA